MLFSIYCRAIYAQLICVISYDYVLEQQVVCSRERSENVVFLALSHTLSAAAK